MILGTWSESYGDLREDEWLLKIRETTNSLWNGKKWVTHPEKKKTGFLTKLTKKGELPKAFHEWGGVSYGERGYDVPIYVFRETFREGWSLVTWRYGKSQNWAKVLHPEGFELEIYLDSFLNVIKETSIVNGKIVGKYKWEDNLLLKED